MDDIYSNAYAEVYEILKYVPQESVNKIPTEIRETFDKRRDKSYNFRIDIT